MSNLEIILLISTLLLLVVGPIGGYFLRVIHHEKSIRLSKEEAEKIVEEGKKEADTYKKESLLEARQEIFNLKKEFDKDVKERKQMVVDLENKLSRREEMLNNRSANLDKREEHLASKEIRIDEKRIEVDELKNKVDDLLKEQEEKLIQISGITVDEAKGTIMTRVENEMANEINLYIKEQEELAKIEADHKAKQLLSLAINKYASETTTERTVSVVDLPTEEMKGRVIGREGRNIRAFEALTGVDLIIDDTPEAVVLSGFDPIRREIAKRTLSLLVEDGRIHPGRIEEVVARVQAEVETFIRETGENAVFETGVGKMHPDLIKLLGKLQFRTSYGQNVLKHSIEVAFFAGKLAAEIGENEVIAKRAGLLHDIGKAVDHEIEGSHVEIGVDLVSRYKEPKEVVDAIASHHGDKEPETIIAVLVAAADALSAARPGARSESIENYLKRLAELENISNKIEGVERSYAIQAGREIRVIVEPTKIDDAQTFKIARKIKEDIEANLQYPGTIKVTVVRETRATDIAK
ncbi:MAG: ribonuclease Y [Acholeplasmataceae bacterium]|jgi:ribonuclease Y|nr:ribonuclease Y [Acholeplasmataceae bacterium]MCK9234161.1 ribonuclease Y [Acholeplasmataceae bacterium]MCK9288925.1 ribonuclease Y [Acholeplasmataceae bacterium]MCK9427519.1 ribonuclease Y [Acholeplasmataceae bacterium]HHT39202.1 ribonuclease Y [Acholeplasmataceae bacterium]